MAFTYFPPSRWIIPSNPILHTHCGLLRNRRLGGWAPGMWDEDYKEVGNVLSHSVHQAPAPGKKWERWEAATSGCDSPRVLPWAVLSVLFPKMTHSDRHSGIYAASCSDAAQPLWLATSETAGCSRCFAFMRRSLIAPHFITDTVGYIRIYTTMNLKWGNEEGGCRPQSLVQVFQRFECNILLSIQELQAFWCTFHHQQPQQWLDESDESVLYLTTHPATSCSNGSCHAHAVASPTPCLTDDVPRCRFMSRSFPY